MNISICKLADALGLGPLPNRLTNLKSGEYVPMPTLKKARIIQVNLGRLGWYQPKPAVYCWLGSKIRYESSGGYENYWRFMYKRIDFVVEWQNKKIEFKTS